jgi:hypothetical protein
MSRRRVVAQCTWLIASSLRSAFSLLPCSRKYCSSVQVGISGAQSRRETAKAPQAFGPGGGSRVRLAGEPAAQKARHEGVAGAENVIDLDWKTLADDTVFEIVRDRSIIDDATHRPAFEHDRGFGEGANGLERREEVAFAGGDQHLFLGADDQVAIAEHGLQMRRNAVRGDVAALARIVARKTP